MDDKSKKRKPDARLTRDKPVTQADLSGYSGLFETADGWEPSMARRFGKLRGRGPKKR